MVKSLVNIMLTWVVTFYLSSSPVKVLCNGPQVEACWRSLYKAGVIQGSQLTGNWNDTGRWLAGYRTKDIPIDILNLNVQSTVLFLEVELDSLLSNRNEHSFKPISRLIDFWGTFEGRFLFYFRVYLYVCLGVVSSRLRVWEEPPCLTTYC